MGSVATATNDSDIQFFGAVDRNPNTNEIKSEMPVWFHSNQIEELKDSIYTQERYIKNSQVSAPHLQNAVATLERDKSKLQEIEMASPRLSAGQRDKVSKSFNEVKGLIAEALPTYDQMSKNTVDSHVEADRMSKPCIEIKKGSPLHDLAVSCNVPVDRKGRITRDHATKIAHLCSKALGDRFFVESLRKK